MDKLYAYYAILKVGDPSDISSKIGPLILERSFEVMPNKVAPEFLGCFNDISRDAITAFLFNDAIAIELFSDKNY